MSNRKIIENYLKQKGVVYSKLCYERRKFWVLTDGKGNERMIQPIGEYSLSDEKGYDLGYSFLVFPNRLGLYQQGDFVENIIDNRLWTKYKTK